MPGIDLAGEIVESESPDFTVGEGFWRTATTSAPVGTVATPNTSGYRPTTSSPLGGLTAWEAAAIGTAGFTAAMSVEALAAHGITPGDGPVVVTGATGGVGSISVDLLSAAGYEVVASTGSPTPRTCCGGSAPAR